jgi:hypothetical protein
MDNNEAIKQYLEDCKERAVNVHEKGNRFGAMYLAMIAGMWNHTARQPIKPNPFENSNNDLYLAFIWGNDASADAMRSNEREMAIRKKIDEAKAKAAKTKLKAKPIENPYKADEKKSIWNTKLW